MNSTTHGSGKHLRPIHYVAVWAALMVLTGVTLAVFARQSGFATGMVAVGFVVITSGPVAGSSTLPAMVIVDVADLRDMTRGDLLLKLAMEDVRSAPRPDPGPGNPDAARTTTTRASNRA